MNREEVRAAVLEYGWDPAERERIAELMRYLAEDPQCRAEVAAYDRIRAALRPDAPQARPEGGWVAFEANLRESLRFRQRRQWPKCVAIATSLLLACIAAWHHYRPQRGDGLVDSGTALDGLGFSAEEISAHASLFTEVAKVFDRQASWVAVSDQASELGLSADPLKQDDYLLLVRLTMLRDSQAVCRADFVIVPGQSAELTVPFEVDHQMRYLVATSESRPERLSVWAELQEQADVHTASAALASDLPIQPGQVFGAGRMVAASGGYQLRVGFARTDARGSLHE
jgi:hypothetical protein